jgi:hypothetical protein
LVQVGNTLSCVTTFSDRYSFRETETGSRVVKEPGNPRSQEAIALYDHFTHKVSSFHPLSEQVRVFSIDRVALLCLLYTFHRSSTATSAMFFLNFNPQNNLRSSFLKISRQNSRMADENFQSSSAFYLLPNCEGLLYLVPDFNSHQVQDVLSLKSFG